MSESNEAAVVIAKALREEEGKQRRRTLLLSSIPVVIGLIVFGSVLLFVNRKLEEVARLDEAKRNLNTEIELLRADATDLFRRKEQALLLLEQAERQLPEQARAETQLLKRGIEQVDGGDYEGASRAYEKALELDPTNELALTLQGDAYLREGRNQEALASFERALTIDPSLAGAHYGKGLVLFRIGRRNAGVAAIEQAFRLEPSYQTRAYGDRAFLPVRDFIEQSQGQSSALSTSEQQLIDDALAMAKRGRLAEAIGLYDAALAENPDNKLVWNWRGYALFRQRDYRPAIASFNRAIQLDSQYAEAYYNRGLALWRSGDLEAALASVDQAFALQPGYERRASQDPQYRAFRESARARSAGGAP